MNRTCVGTSLVLIGSLLAAIWFLDQRQQNVIPLSVPNSNSSHLERFRLRYKYPLLTTEHFERLDVRVIESQDGPLPLSFFRNPIENHVSQVIQAYLAHFREPMPTMMAIDFGANAGYFTQLLASTGLTVHAYEPSADCCAIIANTADFNSFPRPTRVHVHQQGVSSHTYAFAAPITCDPGFIPSEKATGSQTVQAGPINVFNDPRTECVVAKMDTEGSEMDILESLRSVWTATRIHAFVIELAPHVWSSRHSSPEHGIDLLRTMIRTGYRLYPLTDDTPIADLVEHPAVSPLPDLHVSLMPESSVEPFIRRLLERGHGFNVLLTDTWV